MNTIPGNPAPADIRPHAPWPAAAKVAAYVILALLAAVSIWLADRRVDELSREPSTSRVSTTPDTSAGAEGSVGAKGARR